MYWIDAYKLAEIHRETYTAILKSWIPHGEKGEFSKRCGITREYFSCICVLDYPHSSKIPAHKRYPSPRIAKKIASALQAPIEIKRSLVENMELSHVYGVQQLYGTFKFTDHDSLMKRLHELNQTHQQAVFGRNLLEVQRAYYTVRNAAEDFLQQLNPEKHPDSYAQICLLYHDVQCVLNRPDLALRYAKIAQLVLESVVEIEEGYTREQRDSFEINAIRGEAIAYHNMKLDREVPGILINRACQTAAYLNSELFWAPIVKRDLINATVRIPRFSIRRVNKIARRLESICEHVDDELSLLLVRESWLRSLIERRKFKVAQTILQEEIERLSRLSQAGALHKALLFKTGARLAWKLCDEDSWVFYITKAVRYMYQAGLKHQLENIQQIYGKYLLPIQHELGIIPSAQQS